MTSVGVCKPTVGLFRGQKTPARDMSKLIGTLSQRSQFKLCYPSPKITLVTSPGNGYNKILGEGKWREGRRLYWLASCQLSPCYSRSGSLSLIILLSSLDIIRHFAAWCKHFLPSIYIIRKIGPATITVTGP